MPKKLKFLVIIVCVLLLAACIMPADSKEFMSDPIILAIIKGEDDPGEDDTGVDVDITPPGPVTYYKPTITYRINGVNPDPWIPLSEDEGQSRNPVTISLAASDIVAIRASGDGLWDTGNLIWHINGNIKTTTPIYLLYTDFTIDPEVDYDPIFIVTISGTVNGRLYSTWFYVEIKNT